LSTYQILSIISSIVVFIIGILVGIISYFIKQQTTRIFEIIEDFKKEYKSDMGSIFKLVDSNRKDNDASHEKLWIDVNKNKANILVLQSQYASVEKKLDEVLKLTNEMNQHYISIDRALNART
jgi:predicted PurR-regulated permease PerM